MPVRRSRTNPAMMAQQDIVAEIRTLRGSIDADARRIFELSQSLYRMTRRSPADDSTVPYRNYANAWSRFANMVGLGLRRTASSDRVLAMLKPELETEPEPVPEVAAEVPVLPIEEPDDDFDAVYGEVLNA